MYDAISRNLADPPVRSICDVDIALGVNRNGVRSREASLDCEPSITHKFLFARAGNAPDHTIEAKFADAIITRVCDVNVVLAISCTPMREPQLDGESRAVSAVPPSSAANDRIDCALGSDSSDAIVLTVCNVYVSTGVNRHAHRVRQLGGRGWPGVATESVLTSSSNCLNHAVRGHSSDPVVVPV